MAGKFYAVRKGKTNGIFRTWEECREQVHGYPGAEYKSFKTEQEANAFMERKDRVAEAKISNIVSAYVDGSYNDVTKEFSYGMVVLRDGKELKYAKKYKDIQLASMRNVAGEIKGAEAAMHYALEQGLDHIRIYHDYEGIAKWCLGEWKTNKEGTKAYKEFYDNIKTKVSVQFVKVTGHSNDKYNDLADELAKQALGLIESTHQLERTQWE